MKKYLYSKEPGDHLLEVLGTIIIAVVLLALFKDKIKEIFTTALGTTSGRVNDLFETPTP